MANRIVISSLVKKRSELARDADGAYGNYLKLISDVEKLERTIEIFDPDFRIEELKAKQPHISYWAKHGELSRSIYAILREATEPLTSRQIADHLMERGHFYNSQKPPIQLLTKNVARALRARAESGVVRYEIRGRNTKFWELVR